MSLINNIIKISLVIALLLSLTYQGNSQILKGVNAIEADSIIRANVDNPNFVILDIRTPAEHNPEHLEGAIMRNFYDADFSDQLDALDKTKKYVMHCRSGSRSGRAMEIFEDLEFEEVYDMRGGINGWKGESLPVTSGFAPELMFVSDYNFSNKTVEIGSTDTVEVTLTNRANASLEFSMMSGIFGTEFTTDFDLSTKLTGSIDYTFHIYYNPIDANQDNLEFLIQSNDGEAKVTIERTGTMVVSSEEENILSFKVFPNPASDFIQINGINSESLVQIINSDGKVVREQTITNSKDKINTFDLIQGNYFIKMRTKEKVGTAGFTKH